MCPIDVMVTYGRSVHCVPYKPWLLTEGQYIVSNISHGYLLKVSILCPIEVMVSTLYPLDVMVTYGRSVHCVPYKPWLLTEGQFIVSNISHGYLRKVSILYPI